MIEINKALDEGYRKSLFELEKETARTKFGVLDKVGTIVYLKSDKELNTPMTVSCITMDYGYLGIFYVEAIEVAYIGGDGIVQRTILAPDTVVKEQA